MQTRDGYLWLGTLGGVARFDGISFIVFDKTNTPALKSGRIRALYEDGDHNLWIGTEHGGLTRYSNGSLRCFSQADGLPADVATFLTGDGGKEVFVGTTDGIARFDGERFAPLETSSPLPHDTAYALYRDRRGDLWEGTEGSGLIQICRPIGGRYQPMRPILLRGVLALAEGSDGTMLVGAKGGLFHYSEGKLSSRMRLATNLQERWRPSTRTGAAHFGLAPREACFG